LKLQVEVIETIIAFHAKLINAIGYREYEGWAPVKGLMNLATFKMFSRATIMRSRGEKIGWDSTSSSHIVTLESRAGIVLFSSKRFQVTVDFRLIISLRIPLKAGCACYFLQPGIDCIRMSSNCQENIRRNPSFDSTSIALSPGDFDQLLGPMASH
jgi:hypothetical protein